MVTGVNGLNSPGYINILSGVSQPPQVEPLHSCDIEDKAIISAEAKLMNEMEKYNSGQGNEVDLAVTRINSVNQVDAMVKLINTKKDMLDKVLEIGE